MIYLLNSKTIKMRNRWNRKKFWFRCENFVILSNLILILIILDKVFFKKTFESICVIILYFYTNKFEIFFKKNFVWIDMKLKLNFEFINLCAIEISHFNNSMRFRQNSTNITTSNFFHRILQFELYKRKSYQVLDWCATCEKVASKF